MPSEPLSMPSLASSLAGKVVDSVEFARDGREMVGHVAVAGMTRLLDLVLESAGVVDVSLAGYLDEQRRPWLRLDVRGKLALRCQRCLGCLDHVLEVESHLRLIRPGDAWPEDELEEGSEVDADDAIEALEALDVMSLVEDEIILDLPYAPMHEVCELPGGGESDGKTSPFAALAVLKKH